MHCVFFGLRLLPMQINSDITNTSRTRRGIARSGQILIKLCKTFPKKVIWKTRTRTRGHEKRGHGKRGHEKRGHGKHGQVYKNSGMVHGLPCNRFGLPEKFHVSFKY